MEMPRNIFKQKLYTGETQIGLFLGLASDYTAEIIAGAGFDWLLVDGEHGPNDLRSIMAQLRALAPYPVQAAVRTPDHDVAGIKQLLDAGCQTLMVPMVETAAEAQKLVHAMRYPPNGIRGVGTAMARAARWNGVTNYFAEADQEMCLIVQIESAAGLAELDAITSVEGVDGVFIGPSDLAASMGYLGNPGHPAVQAAVLSGIEKITAAGKAAGVFSADAAAADAFRQAGARFLLVGVDALLLRNSAAALAKRFRNTATTNSAAAY